MAKILTITLNPAIDVTLTLEHLHLGAVNRQQHAQSHPAGKGLNVAQVLHDLGHELWVTGFLGQTNRTMFDEHFQTQGFHADFVMVDGETRQNIKIAEQSGRMTDINGKGFWVNAEQKNALLTKVQTLAQNVDVVVLSGSLPQGFDLNDFRQLVQTIQQVNTRLALDTSGDALNVAVQLKPWLLKPNADELEQTFHQPAQTLAEQQQLMQQHAIQVEHLVISMGEHGVHWFNQSHIYVANSAKVDVKSTVGAGDTLLAGMIHGLVSNTSAEETLATACAFASYAVTQIGFHVPDLNTLQPLKQQIVVKSVV